MVEARLIWTGERYLPEIGGTIALEHLHRYLVARELAHDKDVLDIASGEGYGSAMLAEVARQVSGVDISEEAVAHAKQKYQKDNLSFLVGSCAAIPLPDDSVDLVVSFETIEHHDQHQEMMREIKRVLRADGVLIISSPDKYEFTDIGQQGTHYHVKELYRQEFEELVNNFFEKSIFIGQRVLYGSAILSDRLPLKTITYECGKGKFGSSPGVSHPLYTIVVASDKDIPDVPVGLLENSIWESDTVKQLYEECRQLHNNVGDRDRTIADLRLQLQSILSSRSWRFTAPVRFIKRMVIRNFHKDFLGFSHWARQHKNKIRSKNPILAKFLIDPWCPVFKKIDRKVKKYICCNRIDWKISNRYQLKTFEKKPSAPFVTIIVPNFNHEKYLKKRLDSIYSQTYDNYEVILMDDCSDDNSREILRYYYQMYPEKTQLIFNEKNSGGVWYQWKKGIAAASGDLIWIAESDDYCCENFLKELVVGFDDEAVMLSYCRSVFVDGESEKQFWTIEEYLEDIDSTLWKSSFSMPAHSLVNRAWAIKNIVPNVSSAVFRHPGEMELLSKPFWMSMKICGDWLFYLHLVRGGVVNYTTNATNYYRIHKKNTSVSTHAKDIYYQEHELIAKYTNELYSVPERAFEAQAENLRRHWKQTRTFFSEEQFSKCYSLSNIKAASMQRKPNLLMASYAFAAGGGETFPIQLANLFKKSGYSVTFLCCEQEPREDGVRKMLRRDIPVVTNFYLLDDLTRDFGIDIVHSHHAWVDNSVIDLLPLGSCCHHVVSMHGMYEMLDKRHVKKILSKLMDRCGKLVYTAEKNLQPFKDFGFDYSEKLVKIGNALDVYPVNPVDLTTLGITEGAFVVCLVSRAIPEKGWREAIDAVHEAREICEQDVHLLLIGEGPEYEMLKDNSPDWVHLLGFRRNIRDYFAASDLGFLPSRFPGESFPLTIIDCLQVGRPVLASDLGEIPNMLKEGEEVAGSIFSLEQGKIPVSDVAKIIAKYVSDKEFYLDHLRAVNIVAEKFCPVRLRKNYEKVYAQLYKNII